MLEFRRFGYSQMPFNMIEEEPFFNCSYKGRVIGQAFKLILGRDNNILFSRILTFG